MSLVAIALIVGCGTTAAPTDRAPPNCTQLVCAPCAVPLTLRVRLAVGAPRVNVASVPDTGITCERTGDGFVCSSATVSPGDYQVTVSAEGHRPESRTVRLAAASGSCCACAPPVTLEVSLVAEVVPSDGGSDAADAGGDAPSSLDAGPPHAGSDSAVGSDSSVDAATADAGDDSSADAAAGPTCDPDAMRFIPPRGKLEIGQLCDEVFACAPTVADANAITAASSKFTCAPGGLYGCPGWTCLYRDPVGPSLLDKDEVAEICRVTVVVPRPQVTCLVFL